MEELVLSAWRLPRGSTAAAKVGGPLDGAHANEAAMLVGTGVRARSAGAGGCGCAGRWCGGV